MIRMVSMEPNHITPSPQVTAQSSRSSTNSVSDAWSSPHGPFDRLSFVPHRRLSLQPLSEFEVAQILPLGREQVGVVMFVRPDDQQDVVI